MPSKPTRKLALVKAPRRKPIEEQDFLEPPIQGTLFPLSKRNLAVIVQFPDVTGEELKTVLEYSKPQFVVDLRSAPVFAIGPLTRRKVFDILERAKTVYYDVAASNVSHPRDVPDLSVEILKDAWKAKNGPVIFLVDRGVAGSGQIDSVLRDLVELSSVSWDVYEVPRYYT